MDIYKRHFPHNRILLLTTATLLLVGVALFGASFGASSVAWAQSPCGDTEVVVAGDTVNEIAERCGVSVDALLAANPGVDDVTELEIGRVLVIPPTEDPDAPVSYVVQPGDWLSTIAQRYNTTVNAIVAANPDISNPNVIAVGQEILIPLAGGELTPAVIIEPEAGPPGSQIQATLSGFPANTEILTGLSEPNAEPLVNETVVTDDQGAATVTFQVPADAQANQRYAVLAYVPVQDGARDTSDEFIVVSGEESPEEAAPAPSPTPETPASIPASVAVSPMSAPPGAMLEINAAGLPISTTIDIGAGRVDTPYDIVASAQTNAEGALLRSVRLPDLAEPGEQWVIALTPEDADGDLISEPITVTEPITEGEGATLYTSTNIYLIALEDNGRAGMQVGCGDSVVPVEVEIEPTVDVLRGAMQELLSLDSRMYDGFGLYNALYRSDLTIDEIDLTNGAATVELTGDVSLGGLCDGPRFKAQLRQTALQFFSVDEVDILINGELLDDVVP